MPFHRVSVPMVRVEQPYLSIVCESGGHERWWICTFVYSVDAGWGEADYFVEDGLRIADRQGPGTAQIRTGGSYVPGTAGAIYNEDVRVRYNLRCHRCGHSPRITRSRLHVIAERLHAYGVSEISLADLDARLRSSTGV